MKKNNLQTLFNPRSIAIVGASNKRGKIGTILINNLVKLGFKGKVYYVNPAYKILKLKRCYSSLGEINKEIDLAIVAVPAKFVKDSIKEGIGKVRNFAVISAGFAEIGEEGMRREQELAKLAQKYELNILGPNCLGFIVPKLKLNASFASGMPPKGGIAFISQSGALAVAMMDMAKQQNLGFSHVISVGNKMQLDEAHLLDFLAKDKDTKVIGMYLEGIKEGEKFIEAAQKVIKTKPIVILKAGKTAKAQSAISSHTGALAGSDVITNVAFERAGVIRANNLEEFIAFLAFANFNRFPKNEKVAVLTNAGGVGVLTTDAFADKKLQLVEFSNKEKARLRQYLPQESSVENPIDLLGDAQEDRYHQVLAEIGQKNLGALLVVLTPQDQTPVAKVAEVLIKAKNKIKPVLVSVFVGGQKIEREVELLKEKGIYNFATPELAVRTLDVYCTWRQNRLKKNMPAKFVGNNERKKQGQNILAQAQKTQRKALFFPEAAVLFALYGINSPETFILNKKVPTEIAYPVAVKVDSDNVLHKSDKQGVILNVNNQIELEKALEKMQSSFPGARIIAQRMYFRQTEIILGLKRDPIFGSVVIAGLGGIYAEVLKTVDFYLAPMAKKEIEENILRSKLAFLFTGARGQAEYDLTEFVSIIESMMLLAKEMPQIKEIDVNPLFVYNTGDKAIAADIKILLG